SECSRVGCAATPVLWAGDQPPPVPPPMGRGGPSTPRARRCRGAPGPPPATASPRQLAARASWLRDLGPQCLLAAPASGRWRVLSAECERRGEDLVATRVTGPVKSN